MKYNLTDLMYHSVDWHYNCKLNSIYNQRYKQFHDMKIDKRKPQEHGIIDEMNTK